MMALAAKKENHKISLWKAENSIKQMKEKRKYENIIVTFLQIWMLKWNGPHGLQIIDIATHNIATALEI